MDTPGLVALATAFPEKRVDNTFFSNDTEEPQSSMFRGSSERYHIGSEETAVQLILQATRKLPMEELEKGFDAILTNVSVPDLPFTGCGAEVAKALELDNPFILDVHNTGCIAFIAMLDLAQSLAKAKGLKRFLLCNVQTAAGRIFSHPQTRNAPQARIPGDGCGIGVLEVGGRNSLRRCIVRSHPAFASDMQISNDEKRDWWEPGEHQFRIDFSRSKVAAIVTRGNRIVPEAMQEVCVQESLAPSDIGILVTNQPNPVFLRNWRDALEIPEEKHPDTFAAYGNLFGAGIPVTLAEAARDGKVRDGDWVLLGGFSHAGDYSGAALLRWGAP